jgi:hypothetical protein
LLSLQDYLDPEDREPRGLKLETFLSLRTLHGKQDARDEKTINCCMFFGAVLRGRVSPYEIALRLQGEVGRIGSIQVENGILP